MIKIGTHESSFECKNKLTSFYIHINMLLSTLIHSTPTTTEEQVVLAHHVPTKYYPFPVKLTVSAY
jgi:hypothetical protein